jgi:small subunit ribosomal protein S1
VGDLVEAMVLNVDPDRKRISLGMKQVMPDPWETIDNTYPVGTTIEGRIKNVTDFGVFIGIEDGIDGLVHISDLSWSKRIKHPSELYSKNDVVKAVVLNIDKENRRFSLGIKQAQSDPWETVAERYPVGSVVEGKVTNVTDFGVFVEIEEGVEGLIHVSEISKEKINTPVGMFNVGDRVNSKVVNLLPSERRIGLSIKRVTDEEEPSFHDYLGSKQEATSNLGELIRNQLNAEKER